MAPFTNIVLKLGLLVLGPAVGLKVIQSPLARTLLRGQTVRINCTLLPGEERLDSVRYLWFRTRDNPGTPDNKSRNFLKNSRVSVSEGSLLIREVTVDDSDTYHCLVLREEPLPWREFTGEGTELNIQARPEVYLSADAESEVVGIQSLTCVAVGFFPRALNMSWIVAGNGSHQIEPDTLTVNSDGTYNRSSRLLIANTHWGPGLAVTCQVQHLTLEGSVRQSFRFSHSRDGHSVPVIIHYLIFLVGMSLLLMAVICVQIPM